LGETAFYGLLAAVLVTSLASLLSLNAALIALSAISLLALIIMHKLWYAVEAAMFKRTNLIQVLGNQQLSGDRAAATRAVKGGFVATAVALLRGDAKEELDRKKIENVIMHLDYPFKFVLNVEKINTDKLLDRLQTKRSMKEIELARLSRNGREANPAKAGSLKREIEQIEHDIMSMNSGMPLRLARYIATSARSESRFVAEERAKSQVRELASEFGALLNSDPQVLGGNELLDALEIDSMML
jgi:hypothetical protein